ncbi:class I SAM-dependent methyltransferase, partial [Candidatus Dependentiae bacterium]|nr:class I SAM-dependent methyltransferase [Candidatus Dependentiae bacterium]
EGLPEAWSRDDTAMFAKGFFTIDTLPVVRDNVILVSGWFENSLPLFQKRLKDQVIAFMHIDCDIYSSTKTIFDVIGDHVVPGTILVFDELYNYQGFDRHEIKALYEFLERKNYSVEYLAYNVMHEQVAVMIVDSNNN